MIKMAPKGRFVEIIGLILFFSLCGETEAKDWRGVTPLHSTRTDVERILGKPNADYDRYAIGNEVAEIFYSKGPCANGWRVPRETVILIAVHFKKSQRFRDLKIDFSSFDRVPDPITTSHAYYTNRTEGIRYEVFESEGADHGLVLHVYYESTAMDEKRLLCRESENKTSSNPCLADVCPRIVIFCNDNCSGPVYLLTASYVVSCPERIPLYKWRVWNGRIKKGAGSDTIAVARTRRRRPVKVLVKIDNAIPSECPNTQTYTIR